MKNKNTIRLVRFFRPAYVHDQKNNCEVHAAAPSTFLSLVLGVLHLTFTRSGAAVLRANETLTTNCYHDSNWNNISPHTGSLVMAAEIIPFDNRKKILVIRK